MPTVAERSKEPFRRAALFFGAAILGLQCGAWLSSSGGSLISQTAAPDAAVALGSAWCAFRFRNALLRAAFLVLSSQRLLAAASAFAHMSFSRWMLDSLTVAVAMLFVSAGARDRGRMALALATLTFVVAIALHMAASSYMRWIVGGRSIMGLAVWGFR